MKKKALIFMGVMLPLGSLTGIAVALILTSLRVVIPPSSAVSTLHLISVGLLFLILIVEIVSAFKIDDSTFHTALLTGCLLVQYLFSADTSTLLEGWGLSVPSFVFSIVSEVAFVCAAIGCAWYIMYLYGLTLSRKAFITAIPVLVSLAAFSVTMLYGYGYIVHFTIEILLVLALCMVLYRAEKKKPLGLTTYFCAVLLCLSAGAQNVNALFFSGLTDFVPGIVPAYTMLTFAMYIPVYLLFSIRSDSKAVKSVYYRKRAESAEVRALLGQIKPHFIFNSLEAVRGLYHRDLASGDAALNHLSDFLRGSICSFDNELVPFDTEIDNVYSYTEFENMKRDDKIDVMFNIDFTDFSVPPFSIQPFVENAFKYSGVEQIENGCIIISSYRENDFAVVEIVDNGKGFDRNEVSESSHGIRNACERFSLTLGATPEIESAPGKGVTVRIKMKLPPQPTSTKGEPNEDRRDR